MILMALCAVLCGADSWVDVAEWAEDNEAWLRRYLVLAHGTPSHDTFGRVFRLLDGKVFEARFRTWIGGLAGAVAGVVAIDGKTACGSKDGHNTALHTISALVTDSGLCLGQEHTRGKGNEIPAIKALLDALAGGLREFVADGGSWVNKELREHWPKLAGVGMIERQRDIKGAVSTERAFYIGSQGVTSAESFAKAARSHWGIENCLHWVLDVTFREDDCRVRKDHAPHNFAALRKFALALLRQDKQYPKRSLRSRRKTAERLPDYRAALLGLSPRR
jgi:predicted transposase YbfD/YdcC